MIKNFIEDIDLNWKKTGDEPIRLNVIGSTALFIQTNYVRSTKDTDILEIGKVKGDIKNSLETLAGKKSRLSKKHKIYLDIVGRAIPFLPQAPLFHNSKDLNKNLQNFRINVLDIADVVVSKLKTFRPADCDDIRAMIDGDHITHKKLIERFKSAKNRWELDSRATDLPKYVENLNFVEREYFMVEESEIELPDWIDD